MADARLWIDAIGRRRWQPICDDGYARWYSRFAAPAEWHRYRGSADRPSLHRFRRWAIFLARVHERDVARHTWTPDDQERYRCGGLDPAYPGRTCHFRKGHDGPCIDANAAEG